MMRRTTLLIFVLLVASTLIAAGCSGQAGARENYVIQIEGSDGVQYEGQYIYFWDSAPTNEDLAGTAPETIEVEAEQLTVQVTKTSAEGTLKVTLSANGEVVDSKTVTEQGQEIKIMGTG